MIDYLETKEHPITREMVYQAFKLVKANQGASGVDGQSIEQFESKLEKKVYKIWNRMSSGSYHPQAVREVAIPKKTGGIRKLGIPTVEDRVAQQVLKTYLEPQVDHTFHPDSYGYRSGKNAHQAIHQAMNRCARMGWVIDMDIKSFFDSIDHELLLKAVAHYTKEKWVLMYIERWLKADVIKSEGTLVKRSRGTPQGGVISGLLANMFLHFTFDMWLNKNYPKIRFERYSDDIIIHCVSETQSLFILDKVVKRFEICKLTVHKGKTQIVYCLNDKNREKNQAKKSFTFLGYTFKPRYCPTKYGLRLLTSACMSESAKVAIRDKIRRFSIRKFRGNIQQLSMALRSRIRGWMNYYCKFHKWTTAGLWFWLNKKLIEWRMCNKRSGKRKAIRWLITVYTTNPKLFDYWSLVPPTLGKRKIPNFGSAG